MNREIKFRVWVTDDNEMQFPLVFSNVENSFKPLIKCKDGNRAYKDYPVMQYTGLKDKDGKEIYEGDIVKLINSNRVFEYFKHCFWLIEPIERINKFPISMISDETLNEMKVIGNIYQNPELLNK